MDQRTSNFLYGVGKSNKQIIDWQKKALRHQRKYEQDAKSRNVSNENRERINELHHGVKSGKIKSRDAQAEIQRIARESAGRSADSKDLKKAQEYSAKVERAIGEKVNNAIERGDIAKPEKDNFIRHAERKSGRRIL